MSHCYLVYGAVVGRSLTALKVQGSNPSWDGLDWVNRLMQPLEVALWEFGLFCEQPPAVSRSPTIRMARRLKTDK